MVEQRRLHRVGAVAGICGATARGVSVGERWRGGFEQRSAPGRIYSR